MSEIEPLALTLGCKEGDAISSFAVQAEGLSLWFLQAGGMPDSDGILRSSGAVVRNIRLDAAGVIDRPQVQALIDAAVERAKTPFSEQSRHTLIIKSISAKQWPRIAETAKKSRRQLEIFLSDWNEGCFRYARRRLNPESLPRFELVEQPHQHHPSPRR